MSRIAIVDPSKCKPLKCNQECKRICPSVKIGKNCIEVNKTSKIAIINESFCFGCNLCLKACPFNSLRIINLPKELENEQLCHSYGENSFRLYKLPCPRPGKVLGLIGSNGCGKSTIVNILSGQTIANGGLFSSTTSTTWEFILKRYKGTELQKYLQNIIDCKLVVAYKQQNIEQSDKSITIAQYLESNIPIQEQRETFVKYIKLVGNESILTKPADTTRVSDLSGGQQQMLACCTIASKPATVYIFDESTNYLDIKGRINMAKLIHSLSHEDNYIIVIDHDLTILDYIADYAHILYGVPGGYGVSTIQYGIREAINNYLQGWSPKDNLRFRDEPLDFKLSVDYEDIVATKKEEEEEELQNVTQKRSQLIYPHMTKTYEGFQMQLQNGHIEDSRIYLLLGRNGCGKTTFIKLLTGMIESDQKNNKCEWNISYKPQNVMLMKTNASAKDMSVEQYLIKTIGNTLYEPTYRSEVYKSFGLDELKDNYVSDLSGGECQKLAIAVCLGKSADLYMIDEPSSALDVSSRLVCAKVIKRFMIQKKKTAFIVEHDIMMASYLADKMLVFDVRFDSESNTTYSQVSAALDTKNGLNKFLSELGITLQRDTCSHRFRLNKENSRKDYEQKKSGNYVNF